MTEPRESEMTTPGLTTEQLANAGQARTAAEPRTFEGDGPEAGGHAIFPENEAADLKRAWDEIQAGFVDEPRSAVQEADHLVAATMKRLAESFAEERARLEGQWDRGDDVSTEDLRLALRRYRSFFARLLSV